MKMKSPFVETVLQTVRQRQQAWSQHGPCQRGALCARIGCAAVKPALTAARAWTPSTHTRALIWQVWHELWSTYGARFHPRSAALKIEALRSGGLDANLHFTTNQLLRCANYLISQSLGVHIWRKRVNSSQGTGLLGELRKHTRACEQSLA